MKELIKTEDVVAVMKQTRPQSKTPGRKGNRQLAIIGKAVQIMQIWFMLTPTHVPIPRTLAM